MVAMVHGETSGGVVWMRRVSERGDNRFGCSRGAAEESDQRARSEPGPVMVIRQRHFIGEGIAEPVPPSASVVVPFALDKQIVVEHSGDRERSHREARHRAARHRMNAELQHRRTTTMTLTSRLGEPARVFLRHKSSHSAIGRAAALDARGRLAAVRGRPRPQRDPAGRDHRVDADGAHARAVVARRAEHRCRSTSMTPTRPRSSSIRCARCSRPSRRGRSDRQMATAARRAHRLPRARASSTRRSVAQARPQRPRADDRAARIRMTEIRIASRRRRSRSSTHRSS